MVSIGWRAISWSGFDREHRRVGGPRCRARGPSFSQNFDFAAARYTATAQKRSAAATLNGTPHAWLDGLKAVNPIHHY